MDKLQKMEAGEDTELNEYLMKQTVTALKWVEKLRDLHKIEELLEYTQYSFRYKSDGKPTQIEGCQKHIDISVFKETDHNSGQTLSKDHWIVKSQTGKLITIMDDPEFRKFTTLLKETQ